MVDPQTVPIQGDLSRNDVVQLCAWCRGKSVVEFGMGGSTLLLSRIATSLISFDTEEYWFDITRHRIAQIEDKSCQPQLFLNPEPPERIPQCEVLFLDGKDVQRFEWIRRFQRQCKVLIIHDSRVPVIFNPTLQLLAEDFLRLQSIHCHIGESNLLVAEYRDAPVAYENWNHTEANDNRISPEIRDYYKG